MGTAPISKEALGALLARIDVWLLVFGIIVVIGVAGESLFGIRYWWNSRKLQALQRAEDLARQVEMARLNREAGDARKDAGSAMERAAQADERAASANERASTNEKEAARLRKLAEDEASSGESVGAHRFPGNTGGIGSALISAVVSTDSRLALTC